MCQRSIIGPIVVVIATSAAGPLYPLITGPLQPDGPSHELTIEPVEQSSRQTFRSFGTSFGT